MARLGKFDVYFNPERIRVDYTPAEQVWIEGLAQGRQAPKDARFCEDKIQAPKIEDVEAHHRGLLGHVAVARYCGLPVNESVGLSGNTAWEFILQGATLRVHTLQGYLALGSMRWFTTDIAVLCTHQPNRKDRVWMEGWTTKHLFREKMFTANFGAGDRLCMQPVDLFPMGLIWGYVGGYTEQQIAEALRPTHEQLAMF